jgi:exonuclease SbcC
VKALRKIEEVVLINWMSHLHSVIKFDPRMNVITGTSDSGKSAVYRALEYIYHMGQEGYRSFHPGWIRHKASNAIIQVKYDDGYMLERVKGEKNEVRLYKDDEIVYEKLKAGTTYDKEILDFLGHPPYEKSLGSFSFSHQHDPAFLVSQSKDAIPKIISKLSNSGDYDRAAELLKTENLSFNPIIKSSEAKIKEIKNELTLFVDLDDDIAKYGFLETAIEEAEDIEKTMLSLQNIIITARNKKRDLDSLIDVNNKEQYKLAYLNSLDSIQVIADQIKSLKDYANEIFDKEQDIVDLLNENSKAEYFISPEFVNAISFMDNCTSSIENLTEFENSFNKHNEDLIEINELLESDQNTLTNLDDKISSIEKDNSEYEDYMIKNNICLVCGK